MSDVHGNDHHKQPTTSTQGTAAPAIRCDTAGCAHPVTHGEHWHLTARFWCERHTPWSGHYEHCPESCAQVLRQYGVPTSPPPYVPFTPEPGKTLFDSFMDQNPSATRYEIWAGARDYFMREAAHFQPSPEPTRMYQLRNPVTGVTPDICYTSLAAVVEAQMQARAAGDVYAIVEVTP